MSVPIHVVSLASAKDRRQQVNKQLAAFDSQYDFFDAIDGTQGSRLFDSIDSRLHLISTGRLPTQGEIGCYASHLLLWRQCVASGQPICVLEDDCHLEPFFPAALATASQLIDEYGFIRLQTEFRGKKKPVYDAGQFQLHRFTKMAHSTLAYVIAPRVANRFIEHSVTMRCPVDVFIKQFWHHKQTLYGLTPYAARESDLADETGIPNRSRPPKDLITRIARVSTKASWLLRRAAFNYAVRDGRKTPGNG